MIRNDSVSAAIVDYDNYIITKVDWNNRTEANRIDAINNYVSSFLTHRY